MASWQRRARLIIAVGAIAFAVVVAFAFRERPAPAAPAAVPRTDPKAQVESASGVSFRVNRDREEVRVEYDRLLSYADGATRMLGVKAVTERAGGRLFTIEGNEGRSEKNDSVLVLEGDVRLTDSDGLAVEAGTASYADAEGIVRAPGPVAFSRGRTKGTSVGLVYDRNRDVVSLLETVTMTMAAEGETAGLELAAGSAELLRAEKIIRFGGGFKAVRGTQVTEADAAVAYLTDDEQRVDRLELRGNSRISGAGSGGGALEAMTGRDIDLKYGADGQRLERAHVAGNARVGLGGQQGKAGQELTGETVDVVLAPDGATPTSLNARGAVQLTLPASEAGGPTQVVRSETFDSSGDERRGLTSGRFAGDVQYSEKGRQIDRSARSPELEVALGSGLGAFEDARFTGGVRFLDGAMTATAAQARYGVEKGILALSGSAPGLERPRVVSEQLTVDAVRIDVTLGEDTGGGSGAARLQATGEVKSEIRPAKKPSADDARLPTMLKKDQPVIVTADALDYSGQASTATYTGNAWLSQADTSIKAATIVIDQETGDLTAAGPVTTTAILEQTSKDGKKERVPSIARSKDFAYEEAGRRAIYTGDAQVGGPQGEMRADRIELFLRPSGSELERVEAYDKVTLADQGRKTSGSRMTYYGADQRYVVTGTPVTAVDECGRETIGRTLTFFKSADRLVVDGNEQVRTRTTGASKCP